MSMLEAMRMVRVWRNGGCYEAGGDAWRLWVGNIARWDEEESGGRMGSKLVLEIGLEGECLGDFDDDGMNWVRPRGESPRRARVREPVHYLTRCFVICVGRWGISLNVRGKRIDPAEWDRPRWKLNRDGTLKEEWR